MKNVSIQNLGGNCLGLCGDYNNGSCFVLTLEGLNIFKGSIDCVLYDDENLRNPIEIYEIWEAKTYRTIGEAKKHEKQLTRNDKQFIELLSHRSYYENLKKFI